MHVSDAKFKLLLQRYTLPFKLHLSLASFKDILYHLSCVSVWLLSLHLHLALQPSVFSSLAHPFLVFLDHCATLPVSQQRAEANKKKERFVFSYVESSRAAVLPQKPI